MKFDLFTHKTHIDDSVMCMMGGDSARPMLTWFVEYDARLATHILKCPSMELTIECKKADNFGVEIENTQRQLFRSLIAHQELESHLESLGWNKQHIDLFKHRLIDENNLHIPYDYEFKPKETA